MTCTWEPDPGCLGSTWEGLDSEVKERSLMLATSALVSLTYGRVGTCPVTIRPCPEPRQCRCGWNPHIGADGLWRNGCEHTYACKPLVEIDIPGPVGYIEEMKINGVTVDLWNGDWRLDNGHLLVWQGEGVSPVLGYQDLNLPDTEPGTWSITYSNSHAVGREGQIAVAYLAAEFAKACLPKAKCTLPRSVRQIARAGVSFTLEAGLFPNGLTGIDMTDQFIVKWAPPGSPMRNAQVFDPRRARPRRVGVVPSRVINDGSV